MVRLRTYTEAEVIRKLSIPLDSGVHYLSKKERSFLYRTAKSSDRTSLPLSSGRHSYDGSWYYQGQMPTCMSFALLHGIHTFGEQIPIPVATDLLNTACKHDGMPEKEVQRILPTLDSPTIATGFFSVSTGLQSVHPQNPDTDRIIHNAHVIKHAIDNRTHIVTIVNMKHYWPVRQETGTHGVCITGYTINRDRQMNVQVIDSARGKLWMGLDHLSQALEPYRLDTAIRHLRHNYYRN